jgi:outer membrane receptor protein involved in Fe transport
MVAQGNVLTKAGSRAFGEPLGGYAVHFASAALDTDAWTLRLYAENLFNKYAETGVRSDRSLIGDIFGDADGDGVDDHSYRLRRYYHSVLTPMQVGLTFTYRFKF